MYDSVLIPTDGSEGSSKAVTHAVDIAKQYDAALHVLYVVESTHLSDALSEDDDVFAKLEDAGRRAIDQVVTTAKAEGVSTVEASVARGIPHEVIRTYVQEHDVDMIVMGTHGKTGLKRDMLGSVTEKVVRTSDVPVVTVNIGEA